MNRTSVEFTHALFEMANIVRLSFVALAFAALPEPSQSAERVETSVSSDR
jgi:hypothetical protein